jgi:hypothetical protein
MVQLVLKVRQALKERKVQLVLKALKALKVEKARLVLAAQEVWLVFREKEVKMD